MGRFIRFLAVNAVGLGLFAWGQNSLFDWDGIGTGATKSQYGARTGGSRNHK